MKKLSLIMFFLGLSFCSLMAQDSREKVQEKRAREMYRVLGLDSPDEWKNFIRENYTPALISRKMQQKVNVEEEGNVSRSSTENTEENNVDGKAKMFSRLHSDFGKGKINSVKIMEDMVEMAVTGDNGMSGKFRLKFEKANPYRIDGIGIEIINQP